MTPLEIARLAAMVVLTSVVAAPAAALTVRRSISGSSDIPVVAAGETVSDDLYVECGDGNFAGTIEGDLLVLSSSVVISGHVKGNVVVFAGDSVVISGRVDGDVTALTGEFDIPGTVEGTVRVVAGHAKVSGSVARDVMALAMGLQTTAASSIVRDLVVQGDEVDLEGGVGRNATLHARKLVIGSRIGAAVDAAADAISIGAGAHILGGFDYVSQAPATVATGGKIEGKMERVAPPERRVPAISWFLSIFVFIGCAIALRGRAAVRVATIVAKSPIRSLVLGIVAVAGGIGLVVANPFSGGLTPMLLSVSLVLMLTRPGAVRFWLILAAAAAGIALGSVWNTMNGFGVPIILILSVLIFIALGIAPATLACGDWLCARFVPEAGRGRRVFAGMTVLTIPSAVLPYGLAVLIVAALAGTGATLWAAYQDRKSGVPG